jgi:carboxymethylenebutenolidase
MIESLTDIPMPSGSMDAFIAHPEEGGPFPAVFVLMDIWGLREEFFDIARRIATGGYCCIVPNFYYRQGKVRFGQRDERGRMKSYLAIPKEDQDRMQAQMRLITDQMAMEDIGVLLRFLTTQPVAAGPKGAVGYCLGGRYVLQAAATYPDHFHAVASLHGTRLVTDAPLSPHRLADKCRGEIYCGFGEHDDLTGPEIRNALEQAYGGRDAVRYRAIVHQGAHHGYALPDRDVYDKAAANRDWEIIFAMFRRGLTGPNA